MVHRRTCFVLAVLLCITVQATSIVNSRRQELRAATLIETRSESRAGVYTSESAGGESSDSGAAGEESVNGKDDAVLKIQPTETGSYILPLASPLDKPEDTYIPPWTFGNKKWDTNQGRPVDANPTGADESGAGTAPSLPGGGAAAGEESQQADG